MINNSFAMIKDKISHFEIFNYASNVDTAGLHLLTFRILEPYPSKDLALGFCNVISH